MKCAKLLKLNALAFALAAGLNSSKQVEKVQSTNAGHQKKGSQNQQKMVFPSVNEKCNEIVTGYESVKSFNFKKTVTLRQFPVSQGMQIVGGGL